MEEDKSLHVVIAGGSGLIGLRLTELLVAENFRVSHLTRQSLSQSASRKTTPLSFGRWEGGEVNRAIYIWNPQNNFIDANAIKHADFIINLAGESVAGKRWTAKQKQEIIQSRLQSAALLKKSLAEIPNHVKGIICASAIGYYGNREELVNEQTKKGNGFLADTVEAWEQANSNYKIRTTIFRIGNVLSAKGGVLKELMQPLQFFVNPFIGGGQQSFSWIHIDDLCRIIIHAIKSETGSGTFNAVAPQVVSQKEFMLQLKAVKKSFALNITVPAFVFKLILGEQAAIVLEGANVSCEKIKQQGFVFLYPELHQALKEILKNE